MLEDKWLQVDNFSVLIHADWFYVELSQVEQVLGQGAVEDIVGEAVDGQVDVWTYHHSPV